MKDSVPGVIEDNMKDSVTGVIEDNMKDSVTGVVHLELIQGELNYLY